MNARSLTVVNAIGCLALSGLVAVQWKKERGLVSEISSITRQRDEALKETQTLETRRAALERDITVLKETIENVQKAAEESSRSLAGNEIKVQQIEASMAAAHTRLKAWEQAVGERDARIRLLETDLKMARKRLNEAVAKLKAVAE